MKNIVILGSTGSIGRNVLDIVRARPDRFRVRALVAGSNVKKLAEQIADFKPEIVSVGNVEHANQLRGITSGKTRIVCGLPGAIACATLPEADMVVSAIVGAAGLAPTFAAVQSGKTIALANKEALVMAGDVMMREARRNHVKIIPVDSEHSAVFQAIRGEKRNSVRRIILTASGGPFLKTPLARLINVTVEQTLNHPTWVMGRKVTIDSATMMNKGLEVIEARWLFNIAPEKIDVIIHPQSVVHSMVEFHDSSIMAQLGAPDMRVPISYALNYPDRLEIELPRLDLTETKNLTFEQPDPNRFPLLKTACDALKAGGSAPAVLNGANEVAVNAFLEGRIRFTNIHEVVEKTMDVCADKSVIKTVADALHADKRARASARTLIEKMTG